MNIEGSSPLNSYIAEFQSVAIPHGELQMKATVVALKTTDSKILNRFLAIEQGSPAEKQFVKGKDVQWVKLNLNEKQLWVKVDELSKSLNVNREIIRETHRNHDLEKLVFDKLQESDLERGTGLKHKELEEIDQYITAHKKEWLEQLALDPSMNRYFRKENTGLPRTLYLSPTGEVYIHLKKSNLEPAGKGTYKTVTLTIKHRILETILQTKEPFSSSALHVDATTKIKTPRERATALREIKMLEKAKGVKGIVSLAEDPYYYTDKDGVSKQSLIFEYYEQGTLLQAVQKNPEILEDPTIILGIMSQLCRCIDDLHTKGIVHRDIKPQNILFRNVNGSLEIGVADLGLAAEKTDTSAFKQVRGTSLYYSPQAIGYALGYDDEKMGPQDDVYALGVSFFEISMGLLPWLEPLREFNKADKKTQQKILNYVWQEMQNKENFDSFKDNPISSILVEMIATDPLERISLKEAAEEFEKIKSQFQENSLERF